MTLRFESILTSLKHCPFFFLWATALFTGTDFFGGPDPDFGSKKQGVISFFRSVGFRRVAGTWFFGYARDPNHPMRSLNAEDDAEETQTKRFKPADAFNASVIVTYD